MWAPKEGNQTYVRYRAPPTLSVVLWSRSLTGVLLPVGGIRSSCGGRPKDSGGVGLTGVLLTKLTEGISVLTLVSCL